jgi:hypothetical protein
MSRIERSAGRFKFVAWTDGYPASIDIEHVQPNGSVAELRISADDLRDLKYVVKRTLADLEKLASKH